MVQFRHKNEQKRKLGKILFFGEKLAILEENNDRYPSNLDTDPDPDPDPGPALEKN